MNQDVSKQEKWICQTNPYNFIFYPIINENFSQNLQYFTYLCDITITLIKRFRFLQNNFLIVFPITNLSG